MVKQAKVISLARSRSSKRPDNTAAIGCIWSFSRWLKLKWVTQTWRSKLSPSSTKRIEIGQGLAYDRAILHLGVGNKEQALRWPEQSYADRDGANLSWINVEPVLDPLRGEPRFEALVQKVIAPKSEPKP